MAGTAWAQEPVSPEQRIAAARTVFTQLDASAAACLEDLDADTLRAGQACTDFLDLIDGPVVADYVTNCRALRAWRDEFVARRAEESTNTGDSEQTLQRLVDIEYFCGEAALSKRTDNVLPAFSRLRGMGLGSPIIRTRGGSRPGPGASTERSLLEQRRRLHNETQRLWDDLELEILRQRIERSRPN